MKVEKIAVINAPDIDVVYVKTVGRITSTEQIVTDTLELLLESTIQYFEDRTGRGLGEYTFKQCHSLEEVLNLCHFIRLLYLDADVIVSVDLFDDSGTIIRTIDADDYCLNKAENKLEYEFFDDLFDFFLDRLDCTNICITYSTLNVMTADIKLRIAMAVVGLYDNPGCLENEVLLSKIVDKYIWFSLF